MVESYSVGEKVYLKYKVECRTRESFKITGARYVLSLNGKPVPNGDKESGEGECDVNDRGDEVGFMFIPKKTGQYALDIWYDVPVGSLEYDSDVADQGISNVYETRTARFMLPVVR